MSLKMVGAQLLNPKGEPDTPRVRPASASMHQSCLYVSHYMNPQAGATCPELKARGETMRALQLDEINQMRKYGGEEPSPRSARFVVQLPQSPQHSKFSNPRHLRNFQTTGASLASTVVSPNSEVEDPLKKNFPGGVRFNKRTLRTMFKELDSDDSGVITQRELICALRRHKHLLAMFSMIQGNGVSSYEGSRSNAMREEVYRIKELLKEVDTDGSGTMEWLEFVEFFRRAGLLLEYQSHKLDNSGIRKIMNLHDDSDSESEEEEHGSLLHLRRGTTAQWTNTRKFASLREESPDLIHSSKLFNAVQAFVADQSWLDASPDDTP